MRWLMSVIITLVLLGCKEEVKEDSLNRSESVEEIDSLRSNKQRDGLTMLAGNFVYYADAAVLQAHNGSMYGVVINDKMHELAKSVAKFKEEDTDFVPVVIRGILLPKPEDEEGWPYRIDIKEIISVDAPGPEVNDVIKIESKN